jgi:hypothetical protein
MGRKPPCRSQGGWRITVQDVKASNQAIREQRDEGAPLIPDKGAMVWSGLFFATAISGRPLEFRLMSQQRIECPVIRSLYTSSAPRDFRLDLACFLDGLKLIQ